MTAPARTVAREVHGCLMVLHTRVYALRDDVALGGCSRDEVLRHLDSIVRALSRVRETVRLAVPGEVHHAS